MLIDSHTHLNDSKLAPKVPELIARAEAQGVEAMMVVGYDWPSSLFAARLADQYACLHPIVGIHPHDATTFNDKTCEQLYNLASETGVVGYGEIGLDYYRDLSPREVQKKAFIRQIHLARELGKPIVIHDRDAHGDVMQILQAEKGGINGGIIHCFSGSWEMAKFCMNLGFHISIAGPVTYSNAKSLVEIAQKVPLDYLLIETDCPYLTPHPYRGQVNEPAHVRLVAEKIALERGLDFAEIAEASTQNAKKLFGLK